MRITNVEIVSEMREVGCGRYNLDRKTILYHTVEVLFDNGTKRGYSCAGNRKLAERLKICIEAGDAFDADGRFNILMRTCNADLKRLGY